MNDETQQFLEDCKKAGYTHISIGMKDKRVPSSQQIEWYGECKFAMSPNSGGYTGGKPELDVEGKQVGWRERPHVVCAHPKQRENGRPAIWDICKEHHIAGFGASGETKTIRESHPLELGVYALEPEIHCVT